MTPPTLTEPEVYRLLHDIPGRALSCLFAMILLRRPLGVKKLTILTGMSQKTVSAALDELAIQGLAVNMGGYKNWQLTDKGHQLFLFDPDTFAALPEEKLVENFHQSSGRSLPEGKLVEKFHQSPNLTENSRQLPSSSGTTIYRDSHDSQDSLKEQPLQPNLMENFHQIQAELLQFFTSRCGPAKTASPAIAAALAAGRDPLQIKIDILSWLAFSLSEKSINNKPYYIAARIDAGEQPPTYFQPEGKLAHEIEGLVRNLHPPKCIYCERPAAPGLNMCNDCFEETLSRNRD